MSKNSTLPAMDNMADVRQQVDRIDAELMALLKQRFACMDAAARIKQERETVRDEKRKAQVLQNIKEMAGNAEVPVPMAAALWEMLIETSISYEFERWDIRRDE